MKYGIRLMLPVMLFFYPGKAQVPAATIPDFSFEKQNRSPFEKKDLTPGVITFFVFFDTECDHCLHAIEYLNQHQQELATAKVYLVTMSSREKVGPYLIKHGSKLKNAKNTTLLFDPKNHFITRFGPRKYPSLMLYSKEGKLLLYDDEEKNLPRFIGKIKGEK
ncbi:MAG: redoxin domain-containing protein [Chitinophagaceae bacterium]